MELAYVLVQIAVFALYVTAIVDSLRRQRSWWWLAVILLLPYAGPVVYLVNFFVLDRMGLRRIDMLIQSSRRLRELKRLSTVRATPALWQEMGELHCRRGEWAEAIEALKHAHEVDAEDLKSQYWAGVALASLRKHAEAIIHLEYVVGEDPRYQTGEALLALARSQEESGKADDAFETYTRVLAQHSYPEAVVRRARLLVVRGRAEEAREALASLLRESFALPNFSPGRDRPWLRAAAADLRRLGK